MDVRTDDAPGSASEPEEEAFSWELVRRFVEAPLRRPWLVIGPWLLIFGLSLAALFLLPKKYRSSTLILIEAEKVPSSFVGRIATDDSSRRLETIKPEILSRTRLLRVLTDTQPYPETTSPSTAIDRIRAAIDINASGSDGFTIEYVHSNPRKAQEVTDRLATLFIEETVNSREQQVEDAVEFLGTQVSEARKELEKKDEALRYYKEQRLGRLPEQLTANIATLNMMQRELQGVEETLLFARDRQQSLARGVGRSSSAPKGPTPSSPFETDLGEMRRQLSALRGRYTDEHPDVQTLRSRIARLEARLAEAATPSETAADDLDPALQVTREQFTQATSEIKKLEDRRADLERRIGDLRAKVEDTPRTEQELSTLTRDYDKLKENYTALFSKQLEAQMAGRLERRWKGDRFRVLDPAHLPEKPFSPRKTIVLGLGFIFGLLGGLAAAVGVELMDPTVKGVEELAGFGNYPVLARIPHLPPLPGASAR